MHSSKFLGEGIVTSATSVQNPEENFDVLFVYSSTKVWKQVFYSIKSKNFTKKINDYLFVT